MLILCSYMICIRAIDELNTKITTDSLTVRQFDFLFSKLVISTLLYLDEPKKAHEIFYKNEMPI